MGNNFCHYIPFYSLKWDQSFNPSRREQYIRGIRWKDNWNSPSAPYFLIPLTWNLFMKTLEKHWETQCTMSMKQVTYRGPHGAWRTNFSVFARSPLGSHGHDISGEAIGILMVLYLFLFNTRKWMPTLCPGTPAFPASPGFPRSP